MTWFKKSVQPGIHVVNLLVYKMKFTCTILINGEKQHGNITVYKMKLIHVILTILKKKLNLYKMKIIQLSKEKINSIEKHPKTIQKTQKLGCGNLEAMV